MRLYAKKYNNKKACFARASARFSAPVGFGLRPIVPLTKQYSIVLFGRVSLSLSFATASPTPRRRVRCFTPAHAKKIRLPCLC